MTDKQPAQSGTDLVLAALGAELEFRFVTVREVVKIHDESVKRFGGIEGVRDCALLESAVARQLQTATYESRNLADIAASLAFGLCNNHAFMDGNKRTAFDILPGMNAGDSYCAIQGQAPV